MPFCEETKGQIFKVVDTKKKDLQLSASIKQQTLDLDSLDSFLFFFRQKTLLASRAERDRKGMGNFPSLSIVYTETRE